MSPDVASPGFQTGDLSRSRRHLRALAVPRGTRRRAPKGPERTVQRRKSEEDRRLPWARPGRWIREERPVATVEGPLPVPRSPLRRSTWNRHPPPCLSAREAEDPRGTREAVGGRQGVPSQRRVVPRGTDVPRGTATYGGPQSRPRSGGPRSEPPEALGRFTWNPPSHRRGVRPPMSRHSSRIGSPGRVQSPGAGTSRTRRRPKGLRAW